jgi:hypothetical protein
MKFLVAYWVLIAVMIGGSAAYDIPHHETGTLGLEAALLAVTGIFTTFLIRRK